MSAARDLTVDPYPDGSHQLGTGSFWRLQLGNLRILYKIDDITSSIHIYLVGQLPPRRRP
jgi:mRNA-degrading endonuclease RelE of RelBE toxin-antitoxin system